MPHKSAMTEMPVPSLPPAPSLAVVGSTARFPVGRIFCVGRNYADHAREMGADPVREAPFFFTKGPHAILDAGGAQGANLPYPTQTANLHHEIELVVAIGVGGADIAPEAVADHVFGHAVGIDFTRRDRQDEAKAARRPWDMSKSFDGAGPVGAITPGGAALDGDSAITLDVDGVRVQSGHLGAMIWGEAELVAELSRWQALQPGDLIFTGTPAGVGAVSVGARLVGQVDGLEPVVVTIGDRSVPDNALS